MEMLTSKISPTLGFDFDGCGVKLATEAVVDFIVNSRIVDVNMSEAKIRDMPLFFWIILDVSFLASKNMKCG
jgi:hypothetical protein